MNGTAMSFALTAAAVNLRHVPWQDIKHTNQLSTLQDRVENRQPITTLLRRQSYP